MSILVSRPQYYCISSPVILSWGLGISTSNDVSGLHWMCVSEDDSAAKVTLLSRWRFFQLSSRASRVNHVYLWGHDKSHDKSLPVSWYHMTSHIFVIRITHVSSSLEMTRAGRNYNNVTLLSHDWSLWYIYMYNFDCMVTCNVICM